MGESKNTKIFIKDLEMASVIGQHSRDQLLYFSKRLDIYVEEHWEKEVLALAIKETLMERPELLMIIYQKEVIYFLLGIWESEEIWLEPSDWALVHQLQLFGLVDFKKNEGKHQKIYVVKESKDMFYFYLKSKSSKRYLDRYDEWQNLLRGMMSYYGMISFRRLYLLFCKQISEPVDDEILHLFLSARFSFLYFGSFVTEQHSNMEYYLIYDVTNPEKTLDEFLKNYDMKYCIPEPEDLMYAGGNDGLGNWDGISELADILVNSLSLEYYKAVMIVKSSVLYVQNGESLPELEKQFFTWCEEALEYKSEALKALQLLYNSVPVYCLKGWSRKELRKKEKRTFDFKVIQGGKHKKGGEES